MIYLDQITIYQLKIIILYCFNLYDKIINKYKLNNDILLNSYFIPKYDKIHDMYILDYIFNIRINTIINTKNKLQYIYIYKNNIKISELILKKNKIINQNNHKILLSFHYLDNYLLYNILEVYNSGIINHSNIIVNNFYNYKGIKRNQIN